MIYNTNNTDATSTTIPVKKGQSHYYSTVSADSNDVYETTDTTSRDTTVTVVVIDHNNDTFVEGDIVYSCTGKDEEEDRSLIDWEEVREEEQQYRMYANTVINNNIKNNNVKYHYKRHNRKSFGKECKG